jgi:hypothetical protein
MTATFMEEEEVRKAEERVQEIDHGDLKVKLRVRIAKVVLRVINFSCSLVVLALVASALVIFYKTKDLPERNGFLPWAAASPTWPQFALIAIAAVSVVLSMAVLFAYWRGGHRRAEKASIYWTVFSIGSFIFAIVMWGIAAGILNGTKATGEGKDVWGWACKDNKRRAFFAEDVNYTLVCKELDWSFICAIIEVTVELFTIGVYAFAFWRIASKRKLRKSMDVRDKARNSLWLAKLREQESGSESGYDPTKDNTAYNAQFASDGYRAPAQNNTDPYSVAEEGNAEPVKTPSTSGFQLQAAPKRTPRTPVTLAPVSGWSQANSYDPASVPLPQTPAFPPPNSYRQSTMVPPTPSSVRFNLTPSPPPSRS